MIKKLLFLLIGLCLMTAQPKADDDRVLNIQEITSSGGLKIWYVEDHSLPIITINFAFRGAGAINDPDGQIGLGQLVSNTLDEGAGARDAQTFQQALEDHAIDLSFANGRDHFTGKLKTLTKHKALAQDLLKDALTAPRFEEEALNRMKNANIMRIKSSLANTDWIASRIMNDTFFNNHVYARNSGGTISGLAKLSPDNLRDFVKNTFTKDRLIISIAGDVTTEQAKIMADTIFGTLPDNGTTQNFEKIVTDTMTIKKAFKTDSPQSSVQMIWPAFPKSDPDYYAFRVFNHLFGGGGFSSELMEEVREKRGLTYGIYSRPAHLDYVDYIAIESSTSPENIAPMTHAILDVINRFKTTFVDEIKLKEAKDYLVGSLPLKFSSTQSLSRTALALRLDNLPLWYLDESDDHINRVTADDIQRVANRIFQSLEPIATVIAGAVPEDQGFEIIDKIPGVE